MYIHIRAILATIFLLNVALTEAQQNGNPFNYSVPPSLTSSSDLSVGSVLGNFSVSPIGAATYSIPIEVPRGIAGLEPQLSITYNSMGTNGILGPGFSLSGISVITRGPRDIWHDGKAHGISHGNDDAFFLDGQRLIATSPYQSGCDSACFCLELSPYTDVTLHGLSQNDQSALWFSVHTTDGNTHEYGKTANSRQTYIYGSSDRTNAWYISKITDAIGNTMSYQYSKENLFVYPESITYGGNIIHFGYSANRPDRIEFSLGGVIGYVDKVLTSVTTMNGNTYRDYELQYNQNSDGTQYKYSRLSSVVMHGGSNPSGFPVPATTFVWNNLPAYSCQTTEPSFGTTPYHLGAPRNNLSFFAADFNGDGLSDLAELIDGNYGYGSTNRLLVHYAAVTNGSVSFPTCDCTYLDNAMDIVNVWKQEFQMPFALDMNGDGKNELVVPTYKYTPDAHYFGFKVYKDGTCLGGVKWDGIGAQNADEMLSCAGDFNNDGIPEIVVLDKSLHQQNLYYGALMGGYTENTAYVKEFRFYTFGNVHRLIAADMNNDGMMDVVAFNNLGYTVFWNDGTWLDSNVTVVSPSYANHSLGISPVDVAGGDFNGDGIADFLVRNDNSNNLYFLLGNGDGYSAVGMVYTFTDGPIHIGTCTLNASVLDIDGDGRSDVVINRKSGDIITQTAETRWFISTGDGLVSHKDRSSSDMLDVQGRYYVTGDFNGDGIQELASLSYDCYNNNSTVAFRIYRNQYSHIGTGQIASITDGFGNQTQIVYKSMADASVYTKGTGAQFPVVDVAAPIACVASVTEGNGAAPDISRTYTYKGLKAHVQGRGILDMEETTVTNTSTGLVTTTKVDQRDAHSLLADYYYKVTTLGTLSATSNISYSVDSTRCGRAYDYRVDAVNEYDFDHHSRSESNQFDHLTGAVTIHNEGTDDYNNDTYYYNNFTYTGGRYLPQTITKRTLQSQTYSYHEAVTLLEYDSRGLVTKQTEYAGTSRPVVTVYTYDSYGNRLSETTTATGVENVIKTYEYESSHRFVSRSTERGYIITETAYQNDQPSAVTDLTRSAYPQTTLYSYDAFGNVTNEQTPEGLQTTYTRGWGNSRAKKYFIVKQSTGQPWVKTWYDSKGREVLVETIGAGDVSISKATAYDTRGRIASITETTGDVTTTETFSYDNRDRLVSRTLYDNLGTVSTQTTYTYGSNRTVTETVDGKSTTRKYDSLGKLLSAISQGSTVTLSYSTQRKPAAATCNGKTVSIGYDEWGNRTSMTDPDAGTITYAYDAYGRIIQQTDARGEATSYVYDSKGRLSSKRQGNTNTYYNYGTGTSDQGLLKSIIKGARFILYSYDQYARISRKTYYANGSKRFYYTYGSNGQMSTKSYPNSLTVSYQYDSYGNNIGAMIDNNPVWQLNSATGSTSVFSLGSSLQLHSTSNGRGQTTLTELKNGSTTLRSMAFGYDSHNGNMLSRTLLPDTTDTFVYDMLERLTTASSNSGTVRVEYDLDGNITYKTGYGNFYYSPQRPHAVSGVDNATQLIATSQTETEFNAFGKISRIYDNGSNYELTFDYGPDDERWLTSLKRNGTEEYTNLFLGDYEEHKESTTNVVQSICYIDDFAVYMKKGNNAGELYYILRDPLGSVLGLTTADGTFVYKATFDAWGLCTDTWSAPTFNYYFRRGFTGHEMLSEFDLINMNGRLYDPHLGRFLSPDNFVQLPDNSQSFNRYSYCLNNPLKYVDPDGEFWWIVAAAFIGGGTNLLMKISNGQIHSFGEGLLAFGIGATAGMVGAVTGGIAFTAAGGSLAIAGSGGFVAGAIGGIAGSAASIPVENLGNHIAFGDKTMSLEEYMIGVAAAGAMGGIVNGLMATYHGNDFWRGKATFEPQWGIPSQNPSGLHAKESVSAVGKKNLPTPEEVVNKTIGSDLYPKGKGHYSVYYGTDESGSVRYVGITRRQPELRFKEHYHSMTPRSKLYYHTNISDLSYFQAHIIEQNLINAFQLGKNGGQLFNIINSISPRYWNKYGIIIDF